MSTETHEKFMLDIVGEENVLTDPVDLLVYSTDATPLKSKPCIVVFPTTTEQVTEIIKYANEKKVPVVPRGAGSSLSGGPVPIKGGIVLDFTKMNRILEIDEENFTVLVEPGVVYKDLDKELAKRGLFFPPDPSSQDWCTIGGMIAENAGGMRAVKYGVTRDWIMGAEVVLPTGKVIWSGAKTRKFASGYEIYRLMVGSEGTLGVITKAILRVTNLPNVRLAASAYFETLKQAGHCIYEIMRSGIDPSGAEVMDRLTMEAVSKFTGLTFPECGAMVIIELDGDSKEYVNMRLKKLKDIFSKMNAISYKIAETEEEAENLFESRHSAYSALTTYKPTAELEDVTVPISKVPEMFEAINKIAEKYNLLVATFGHMGDGNIHPNFLYDERDPDEVKRVEKAKEEIFRAALEMGGTLTGEHGIGAMKREYFALEHKSEEIEAMKIIKQALDPNNILNPGKIW
ncbi:MAG: FAD-binding oxidoreductase [Candidatus Odinarchaeia archaeon]